MQKFLCPNCGKRAMIKKEVERTKYILICSECGYQPQMLPKNDKKKGVV